MSDVFSGISKDKLTALAYKAALTAVPPGKSDADAMPYVLEAMEDLVVQGARATMPDSTDKRASRLAAMALAEIAEARSKAAAVPVAPADRAAVTKQAAQWIPFRERSREEQHAIALLAAKDLDIGASSHEDVNKSTREGNIAAIADKMAGISFKIEPLSPEDRAWAEQQRRRMSPEAQAFYEECIGRAKILSPTRQVDQFRDKIKMPDSDVAQIIENMKWFNDVLKGYLSRGFGDIRDKGPLLMDVGTCLTRLDPQITPQDLGKMAGHDEEWFQGCVEKKVTPTEDDLRRFVEGAIERLDKSVSALHRMHPKGQGAAWSR